MFIFRCGNCNLSWLKDKMMFKSRSKWLLMFFILILRYQLKVFFFSLNIFYFVYYYSWRNAKDDGERVRLCAINLFIICTKSNVQINGKFLLSGFSVLVAFAFSHFTCLWRHKIKWKSHPDELNSVNIKCARWEKSLKLCYWILRKIDFSCFGS